MTKAMLKPPMHPGKQVQFFADMSKTDYHKTSCAK